MEDLRRARAVVGALGIRESSWENGSATRLCRNPPDNISETRIFFTSAGYNKGDFSQRKKSNVIRRLEIIFFDRELLE